MVERISLLHLTDLHFESNSKAFVVKDGIEKLRRCSRVSYSPERAELLAQWASLNKSEFHAITITGDIANTGLKNDLEVAHSYVSKNKPHHEHDWLNEDQSPTISNSSKNIFILPGNHDRFDHPTRKPNNKNFDEIFKDFWTHGAHIRGKNSTFQITNNTDAGLSILSIDLTLEDASHAEETIPYLLSRKSVSYYGQGKAYQNRIKELINATKIIKNKYPNYPIVWLLHYELNLSKTTMKLLDESGFMQAVKDNNIDCVLNGHTHKFYIQQIVGTCTSITSGSPTSTDSKNNSFSLIDFYVEGNKIKDIKVIPMEFKKHCITPWRLNRNNNIPSHKYTKHSY